MSQWSSAKRILSATALLSAVAVTLGSWAPFNLQPSSFSQSWNEFLRAGFGPGLSRPDFVANILLGIPFAFSLLGFLIGERRRSTAFGLLWSLIALLCSLTLSLFVELGQGWCHGRIASLSDWGAQTIGALIGVIAWWIFGKPLSSRLNLMFAANSRRTRFETAVTLVAAGVIFWAVLPGDVLVSPADIGRKWARGGIELIPFSVKYPTLAETVYQWVASAVIAIPLGLWASLSATKRLRQHLGTAGWALVAIGMGLLPEVLQIPIAARSASATDAVFGALGAGAGIWIGLLFQHKSEVRAPVPKSLSTPAQQPATWYLAAVVYFVIVCLVAWYPFEFETDPTRLRELLRDVASNPFSDYKGSNLRALFVTLRTAVLSTVLGGLLGIGTAMIASRSIRPMVTGLMVVLAVFTSGAIELGQLLEVSHSGAGIAFTVRLISTWIGIGLGQTLALGTAAKNDLLAPIPTAPSRRSNLIGKPPTSERKVQTQAARARGKTVLGMDGLRAGACLAVFGVHWQQTTGISGEVGPFDATRLLLNGNTGVALFIILSGFLLSLPVFAAPREHRLRDPLPGYWRNRAVRILPAYWLTLFSLVVITLHFRTPPQWLDVALHLSFLHNVTPQTLYSINPPFWALAIFVQCYVLFAIMIGVLKRVGPMSDLTIVSTFASIGIACQTLASCMSLIEPHAENSVSRAWLGAEAVCLQHSLLNHAILFCLGVVAAFLHQRIPAQQRLAGDIVVAGSSALLLVILATELDELIQIPGGRYTFPAIPLLLTALLLAAPRSKKTAAILGWGPIRGLGVISYGFYLFHLPIMKALEMISEELGWAASEYPLAFGMVVLAVAVAVSEIFYRLVEQPIARTARKTET